MQAWKRYVRAEAEKQDALDGLIYAGDIHVTDVESHRRPLAGTYEIIRFPSLLLRGYCRRKNVHM